MRAIVGERANASVDDLKLGAAWPLIGDVDRSAFERGRGDGDSEEGARPEWCRLRRRLARRDRRALTDERNGDDREAQRERDAAQSGGYRAPLTRAPLVIGRRLPGLAQAVLLPTPSNIASDLLVTTRMVSPSSTGR